MHTSRRQTLRTLLLAPLAAWFLPKQGQAQESPTMGPYHQWEQEIAQAVKLLAPGTLVKSIHWHVTPYSPKQIVLWLDVERPSRDGGYSRHQTLRFCRVNHGTYSSAHLEEI